MADTEEVRTSSLVFSEEELDELDQEFATPDEETPEDKPEELGEDDEDEDDEEEEESELEEEEGEEEEEDALASEELEGSEKADEKAAKKAPDADESDQVDKEDKQGYELLVDGQPIRVETEDDLKGWAQKGIHYEKTDRARQKTVDDATFTMNAMINDPMAALQEIWTSRYHGNVEQARAHVAKAAEAFLEPFWKELTAKPAERLQLQQSRFAEQSQAMETRHQQAAQGQFSQEDLQFIQTMDAQITGALETVDLPKADPTIRKWMADVMREGLDRGIDPDPTAAAEFIKSQQDARHKALGNRVPKKDRKTSGKKTKAQLAKIAQAKARRSKPQKGGTGTAPRKSREPHYMNTREWLDGLNKDLNLEP